MKECKEEHKVSLNLRNNCEVETVWNKGQLSSMQ